MENTVKEFEDLILNGGTCYASLKITKDGMQVGFMYRESKEEEDDSGWRFYSGTEDQDYVDDPDNLMLYDINTIANYDKAIIPILKKPIGTEWERIEGTNRWQKLEE
jgi:hypothetical protein